MSRESDWDLSISSKSSLFDLRLRELWQNKDLLMLLVKRDIISFYKQTILGPLWFVIQPLFTMVVFVFVFGNLAGLSTSGLPKPIFYLCGITFWTYFSQTVIKTSNTLKDNQNILSKVYFPRIIMPLSVALSHMVRLGIQFILFLAIVFFFLIFKDFEWQLSPYLWLFPILVFLLFIQSLGFGLMFSALTTKYRDLVFLLTFGIQLLMYASPVAYPVSQLSGKALMAIYFNPLTRIFEGMRMSLFGVATFDMMDFIISVITSLGIFGIGLLIFNKVERNFVDTI